MKPPEFVYELADGQNIHDQVSAIMARHFLYVAADFVSELREQARLERGMAADKGYLRWLKQVNLQGVSMVSMPLQFRVKN